jgi:hypothetical protein
MLKRVRTVKEFKYISQKYFVFDCTVIIKRHRLFLLYSTRSIIKCIPSGIWQREAGQKFTDVSDELTVSTFKVGE